MKTLGNTRESTVSDPAAGTIPLVRPAVDERQAAVLALRFFGLEADAVELGSNQDRNFLLTSGDGRRHVLKFDNAVFGEAELCSQNEAVALFASGAAGGGVSAARVLPGLDGDTLQLATDAGDTVRHLRLFEFVSGGTLVDAGYLGDATLAGLGSLAASVSRTLAGFGHPGLDATCSGTCAAGSRWCNGCSRPSRMPPRLRRLPRRWTRPAGCWPRSWIRFPSSPSTAT